MLRTKFISSLDKCFIDDNYDSFAEIKSVNIYKNTDAVFQYLAFDEEEARMCRMVCSIEVEGDLAEYVKMRTVECIPNYVPVEPTPKFSRDLDPDYVRTEPGLYPDILMPLHNTNGVTVLKQQLHPVWIDVKNDGSISAGEHTLKFKLFNRTHELIAENEITINVIDTCLPEQETKVTQWFYADCLADYYDVDVWSERHFEICRRFIQTAVDNGINMILTPVLTPPLDTAVGWERTTNQLVQVALNDGKYSFDLSLLDRWVNMCLDCGVKYFEINHLFTQWGAFHCPKVMATVDGEYKKIFGWESAAEGEEYVTFLNLLLKEVTSYFEGRGLKDNVYFHISDEPWAEHLPQYKLNRKNIGEALKGWHILDALSHVEYFKEGLCENPVAQVNRILPFLEEDIKERWVYYCCYPYEGYSNRFMAMHSARTRFLGTQMFKYGLDGFLHWGYNYYNNQFSWDHIDPMLNANAGHWAGGGDAVSVYPGRHGMPLESIRIVAFRQGLEDIRAMKLCESLYSKQEVVAAIEEAFGGEIVFEKCANDTATMQRVRDAIDNMIIAKL
ncbi:MAG: DUF4091 domain-containing protein [Clostridia bacterium]|nr:DUF4091 domain-containing protein [Clostridia bacterium]